MVMMYWRAIGINILQYLDDFFSLVMGYDFGCPLAKIVEEDIRSAGLTINWDKGDGTPQQERLHLGFDIDLAAELFKDPIARWKAVRDDATAILNSTGTRV